MITSPRVSILIPCYNAVRWIRGCVESALSQTVEGFEIIVVDDGSTDGSREVLESFGAQIQLETSPNKGGNAARNRALELSRGEWIQFLDADDYLLPEKIKNQLAVTTEDIDAVYSRVLVEDTTSSEHAIQYISQVAQAASTEERWMRWQLAQTGAVLWRREALNAIGGWNERYPCCQDNELTMRAIMHGVRFQYCEQVEAVYRIWSDKTVSRRAPSVVVEVKTQLMDQMLDWLAANNAQDESIRLAAGEIFFESARLLAGEDVSKGSEYAARRRQRNRFHVAGPAAPLHYRLVHRLIGFGGTERVARWFRR